MSNTYFSFKQFTIHQERCAMKVGTDGTLLGAWAHGGHRILDVGTGTGLIALMMAQRFPESILEAIEIDGDAAGQAVENVACSPFSDRVSVHHISLQEFTSDSFDTIICNPPYFVDALKNPDAQRLTARHTDALSYRDLLEGAKRLLNENGELSVILPFDYQSSFETEAFFVGFSLVRRCAVRTTPNKAPRRFLSSFRKSPTAQVEFSELVIGSDSYLKMMKDFYLEK